jgi:hypothetical protein
MGTLSTTAWVLHDLGLAAGFGGPLFGEVALQKAMKSIPSDEERSRVLERAWGTYNVVDAVCLGVAASTWLIGRTRLSGREVDRYTRSMVLAKDILMGAALGTGLANFLIGRMLHEHKPGAAMPAVGAAMPAVGEEGPSHAVAALRKPENLKRILRVLGPVNTALAGGTLAITTVLAMRSGRSAKWSIISRFLP